MVLTILVSDLQQLVASNVLLPDTFGADWFVPCVIMIIFCSNYLTEGAHSL